MKKEAILNIIQENYNKFKGTNEAELHASEEIFSLHSIETKELQEQLAIEKMNSENSEDSYNVIIHELKEQLESSQNGMLNLIKYKNELVQQLEQKEFELKAADHVLAEKEKEIESLKERVIFWNEAHNNLIKPQ